MTDWERARERMEAEIALRQGKADAALLAVPAPAKIAKRHHGFLAPVAAIFTSGLVIGGVLMAVASNTIFWPPVRSPEPMAAATTTTTTPNYPLSGTPICGQASVLSSPYNSTNEPALGTTGAVVVIPSGATWNNSTYEFSGTSTPTNTPNTTFYFTGSSSPYVLGTSLYDQVPMAANDWYVGQRSVANGVTLSGQYDNQYAFISNNADAVSSATADHIEYLTVEQFTNYALGGSNSTGASGWLDISQTTAEDNYPGSGVEGGTGDVLNQDCLTSNGDYGLNAVCTSGTNCSASTVTSGPQNLTLENSEISYNDQCNWEAVPTGYWPISTPSQCGSVGYNGCGCAGGAHFWNVDGSTVTGDYFHDNFDVASWWDTDNNGETIEHDYYADNFAAATDIEISYNALIEHDNFVQDGWGGGECAAAAGNPCYTSGNLAPAIYLSESGGNAHVVGNSGGISTITVSSDNFSNNWDAVLAYQSSNRYCSSPGNTSTGYCTLGANVYNSGETFTPYWDQSAGDTPSTTYYANDAATGVGCGQAKLTSAAPSGSNPDYYDNCAWKLQNVMVTGNTLSFATASVGGCPASWGGCGSTATGLTCASSGVSVCAESGLSSLCPSGISWSPYQTTSTPSSACGATGNAVPDAVVAPTSSCLSGFTFSGCIGQANVWTDNAYSHTGSVNWAFMWQLIANNISIATWQSHGQDTAGSGSTFT